MKVFEFLSMIKSGNVNHFIGKAMRLLVLLPIAFALSACLETQAPKLSFTDIKGNTITPNDYKDQVMLVNFWATSCTTCVKEMPDIVAIHQKFADKGYRTVAVAMSYDRPDYVVNYAESNQLPFDVVLDLTGEIAQAYNEVKLTPTTYLVNRQGKIIKTIVGEPDFPALEALIEKALAGQA